MTFTDSFEVREFQSKQISIMVYPPFFKLKKKKGSLLQRKFFLESFPYKIDQGRITLLTQEQTGNTNTCPKHGAMA